MIHRQNVAKYEGTPEELAEDIGNLRYDALADFLKLLAAKMEKDALADGGRGRHRLAAHLHSCSVHLAEAGTQIEKAWVICEPHMKDNP